MADNGMPTVLRLLLLELTQHFFDQPNIWSIFKLLVRSAWTYLPTFKLAMAGIPPAQPCTLFWIQRRFTKVFGYLAKDY